jgi:hypothetical protein
MRVLVACEESQRVESWWVRMTVHKDCWRELCKSIAEKKEEK